MLNVLSRYLGLALACSLAMGSIAQGATPLAERDLSIQLPTDDASLRISLKDSGFSEGWYRSVLSGFEATSVGPAVDAENSIADWQVVSVRVVPCQSLLSRPHRASGSFCWPEVRFVLQPIVKNLVNAGRNIPYFADDRAIHVLYDFVSTGRNLPAEAIQQLGDAFLTNEAFDPMQPGASPRDTELWQAFLRERDASIISLLKNVTTLRDASVPASDFAGIGMRPEYALASNDSRKAFESRLKGFLASLTGPNSSRYLPKEVTAFSLPEGRDPATLDEWVFLKFRPLSADRLERAPISLVSARDSSNLASSVDSARVSMVRDDDNIYPAQTAAPAAPISSIS